MEEISIFFGAIGPNQIFQGLLGGLAVGIPAPGFIISAQHGLNHLRADKMPFIGAVGNRFLYQPCRRRIPFSAVSRDLSEIFPCTAICRFPKYQRPA